MIVYAIASVASANAFSGDSALTFADIALLATTAVTNAFDTQALEASFIQTYEINTGCFVWAQYVDQSSRCLQSSLTGRIAGWIQGG